MRKMRTQLMLAPVLCLMIGGCSTPASIVSYSVVTKPDARAPAKVSPDLLVVPPLSDVPLATDYPSLQERAIKFGADLVVHRTRLTELIGAVKQREYSEDTIVAAEKERAAEIDALVKKLNENEARRAKPWYQQLFGKRKD